MPISGEGSEGAWEAHTEFRLVPGLLGLKHLAGTLSSPSAIY